MMRAFALIPFLVCWVGLPAFAQESLQAETPAPEQPQAEMVIEFSDEAPVQEAPTECLRCFVQEIPEEECRSDFCFDMDPYCDPEEKWYFEVKPGYFLFTDKDMQKFFDDGGFAFRAEAGCKFWGPLMVWIDGGYFQGSGKSIGGAHSLEIKLGTITLGLKAIYYYNSCVAVYAGAGPRLFMMMMKNNSPFVRGDDNEIGIGGGFDAGLWFFPVPQWPNFFFDLFADYSWKKLKVEADEISSFDFDVDVSGLTAGLGIGLRF